MRWKIAAIVVIFFLGAGLMGTGLVKWKNAKKQKSLNEQLERCKSWIALGEHAKAQSGLETILRENPKLKGADSILATLAGSYAATKADAKAIFCWQKIYSDYPESPHIVQAMVELADKSATDGDREKAETYWDKILSNFADSDWVDDALFGQARMLVVDDKKSDARKLLNKILKEYPESNRRTEVEDYLGRINIEQLLSPNIEPGSGDQIYVVKRGDTLDGIGRRNKVSPDLLMKVNQINNVRALSLGRRLKIPSVDFSIVVDKTDNTLVLLNKGEFFKRYRVRTGREDWRTPTGTYEILSKVKDPTWKNPSDGRSYAPEDPANELGTRWMAFGQSGLGIHGTNKPDTIGTYASAGCVGLLNEEVEELYDLVPRRTPVEIKGKTQKAPNEKTPES